MAEQTIDKSIPIPMFYQLKTILLSTIESGQYGVGDMIPTELELSKTYGISRTTVRQAVLELVQQGYLKRVKGKGTFVSKPKLNHGSFIQKIESFHDEIRSMGMVPSTEVLELSTIHATEDIATALQIEIGNEVVFLHRKRMADGEPIVSIKTYLPYASCSYVLTHDFQHEKLYSVLSSNSETQIHRVYRTFEATAAKESDRNLLYIPIGKPVHHFSSIGCNKSDKPIEYSLARYRGDRNCFKVTVELHPE